MQAPDVISKLKLQPHPEGGWYRETWRGGAEGDATRGCGTCILFMLEAHQRSHWHRIDATELWLHQSGGPVVLNGAIDGERRSVRLGPDIAAGDELQLVVRPHEWQSANALDHWVLVACVVVPAFQFETFELAARDWSP